MKKYRFVIVLFLVAAALAVSAFGVNRATTTTLKVVEHATTDTVTDTGDKGDTVGDILTFANEVFDEGNKEKVGTDNGYCFRTVVGEGAAYECHWILILKDGQLTVDGPFYDAGDSVLAITGGTGTYNEARGQMTLHARDAKGSEYDFVYDIVQ
jgi:hypothetical protein